MQHPVIARKHFEELGIAITANTYLPEGTLKATLVDKLLMREARWLTRNKAGVLVGYDPVEDLQIGARLVLNQDGKVQHGDVLWTNLVGGPDKQLQELLIEGKEAVITHARTTHGFIALGMELRGWGMGWDEEGEAVALCRNHVASVSHIDRNV
jgi:hypothetical protein